MRSFFGVINSPENQSHLLDAPSRVTGLSSLLLTPLMATTPGKQQPTTPQKLMRAS